MAEIRPLEHEDLPGVVALVREHMNGWRLDEHALGGLMLDHPWADEELRSLVAVEGGRIVGFTGAQARRLRFDGGSLRGVCCTHAVVDTSYRRGAVGALLLMRILRGPQDVTWADSATEAVAGVYGILGGHVDFARSCDWMLVLRPARWLGGIAAAAARREAVSRRTYVPVGAVPVQAAGRRLLKAAHPELPADVSGEDASAAAISAEIPRVNAERRIWIAYDAEQLDHLFRLVERFDRPLVRRVVRRGGEAIGWYAYVLRPGGASRVLHLAALDVEADAVFGELVEHAREHGSAALTGRSEPHLQAALERRFAVLGFARNPAIRAKDPSLDAILSTDRALLTRLDGEVFGI